MEASCYGQYFLEVGSYYSRENLDGSGMLLLIYQSLRALLKPEIPNPLVRRIFELKAMVMNGEYTEHPPKEVGVSRQLRLGVCDRGAAAGSCIPLTLTPEVFEEFQQCVETSMKRYVDRPFHSLEILKVLEDKMGK